MKGKRREGRAEMAEAEVCRELASEETLEQPLGRVEGHLKIGVVS